MSCHVVIFPARSGVAHDRHPRRHRSARRAAVLRRDDLQQSGESQACDLAGLGEYRCTAQATSRRVAQAGGGLQAVDAFRAGDAGARGACALSGAGGA